MRNTYRHVQYNKWESMWSCLASSSWWLSISVSLTTTSRGFPAPRVSKQLPAPEEKNKAVAHDESKTALPFMELWRGAVTLIQLKTYQPHDRSSCLPFCLTNQV